MPTPTSNPNAKVPGASPGNPSPGTVPNLGAGYKPPSAVVIDPDANPYYGQSKATNGELVSVLPGKRFYRSKSNGYLYFEFKGGLHGK